MPKGVYDRTAKKNDTKLVKAKKGRKPKNVAVGEALVANAAPHIPDPAIVDHYQTMQLMHEARETLKALANLPKNGFVDELIHTHLGYLERSSEKAFKSLRLDADSTATNTENAVAQTTTPTTVEDKVEATSNVVKLPRPPVPPPLPSIS